jgi:hypothetical protein
MHTEVVRPSDPSAPPGRAWIDLDRIARVRVTSEDPAAPIRDALIDSTGRGWRAQEPGRQTIWIHLDPPQDVRHIYVRFEARESRTQEFVLRWSGDRGETYREVVRQQFNFSPDSTPVEEEHYLPGLSQVTDLELMIIPNLSGGAVHATLQKLRIR